jgi:hypothetical protein
MRRLSVFLSIFVIAIAAGMLCMADSKEETQAVETTSPCSAPEQKLATMSEQQLAKWGSERGGTVIPDTDDPAVTPVGDPPPCPGVWSCYIEQMCENCNKRDPNCTLQDTGSQSCEAEFGLIFQCKAGKTVHISQCPCPFTGYACRTECQSYKCN